MQKPLFFRSFALEPDPPAPPKEFQCVMHARLHILVCKVAEYLRCAPHEVLGDYDGVDPLETGFDKSVFERLQRGSYLIGHALYLVQNRLCLTRLRLYHIVQHDEWIRQFVQVMLGSIAALVWFDAQTAFPPVPSPPIHTDYVYAPTKKQTIESMIEEARGPPRSTTALPEDPIRAKMRTLAMLGTTEERVTRLLHGKVEFARVCARFKDTEWLRGFLLKDCACTF